MKTYIFTSTKTKEQFTVCTPDDYEKIALPYFNEWVTALKSGKYNQCRQQLCKPISNKKLGHCCLGVLSKVQGRLKKSSNGDYKDDSRFTNIDTTNPCFKVLSYNGYFPINCRVLKNDTFCYKFVYLNDNFHLSFKDIAKVIEIFYKPQE